jgi:hypothetical protein
MQRKREMEREERRVRSKSPGNVTTMSEFECTPNNQSRIFIDRNAGFNTLQPTSAKQTSANRSPR